MRISGEFNFAVEQYITKLYVQKGNFSIAFSDILKYNLSERKKILISRLISKTVKFNSAKINSAKISSLKVIEFYVMTQQKE